MNATLVGELRAAIHDIAVESSCRVVVLSGQGRAFCAGLDKNGYGDVPGSDGIGDSATLVAMLKDISQLLIDLRQLRQPVISAVNGAAIGGGFSLVLGSDLRLAGASARFSVGYPRLGVSACEMGTSWLLPRLVGTGRAHELMLTGRMVDAREAAELGIVLEVTADDLLLDRADELANQIMAANSPLGLWMSKQTMWAAMDVPALTSAIELENRTQALCATTADFAEAQAALVEGRPAHFNFT
jgi:enoyl-CoA hydratase